MLCDQRVGCYNAKKSYDIFSKCNLKMIVGQVIKTPFEHVKASPKKYFFSNLYLDSG